MLATVGQFTQASAQFGDDGRIGTRADLVLAACDRDHDCLTWAVRILGRAAAIMALIVAPGRRGPAAGSCPSVRRGRPLEPAPESAGGAAWGAGDRQPRRLLNDIRPSLMCVRNS